jgi:hypothetical protein
MKKVSTEYVARLVGGGEYCIFAPDLSRIDPNGVLGCVVYEDKNSCSLYYNEGGFTPQELERAGYRIVDEIFQLDTYEEETNIYSRNY